MSTNKEEWVATRALGAAKSTVTGAPLSPEELARTHGFWRACNYLAAGMIYLRDNPLLQEPLIPEHIKKRLLGHWGSSPGLSFVYTHMNRVIREYDVDTHLVGQVEAWILDHVARSRSITSAEAGTWQQRWLLDPLGRFVARLVNMVGVVIASRKRRKAHATEATPPAGCKVRIHEHAKRKRLRLKGWKIA